jgi:hypothetical protein
MVVPDTNAGEEHAGMREHPDSLWQPYPDEVCREHSRGRDYWSSARRYRPGRPEETTNQALEVLEQRYARGEIERQEFEERRAVLRGAGT